MLEKRNKMQEQHEKTLLNIERLKARKKELADKMSKITGVGPNADSDKKCVVDQLLKIARENPMHYEEIKRELIRDLSARGKIPKIDMPELPEPSSPAMSAPTTSEKPSRCGSCSGKLIYRQEGDPFFKISSDTIEPLEKISC